MYNSSHAHHAEGNKTLIPKIIHDPFENLGAPCVFPYDIVALQFLFYSPCLRGVTGKCLRASPTRAATSVMATVLA